MHEIRKRTYEILDIGAKSDRLSRVVDTLLISLISLNVISVILETLPALRNSHQSFFDNFEIFSVIIFSIEYLARVWAAVEDPAKTNCHPFWGRLRYMLTPMALIELIVIMPFYLGYFLPVDLRFMRVLRLLRVFKLTRYSSSMSVLLKVLADESRSIGASLFVLCMLIILASSFTYLAEHKAQPEAFASIPAAMWWAVITMTGVGYGDVTPVTVIGKILAAIISIGIVALPAGLLASGFSEAFRQRRAQYEKLVDDAMDDGIITPDEEIILKKTQDELGIDADEADIILDYSRSKHLEKQTGRVITNIEKEIKIALDNRCPHCGETVDWRTEKRNNNRPVD